MTRSLPRKSEKSVKLGNKRLGILPTENPYMGAILGGYALGEQVGGAVTPRDASRECIAPGRVGGIGSAECPRGGQGGQGTEGGGKESTSCPSPGSPRAPMAPP